MGRSSSTSGAEVAEDGVDVAVWVGSIGRQVARLSCIPEGGVHSGVCRLRGGDHSGYRVRIGVKGPIPKMQGGGGGIS